MPSEAEHGRDENLKNWFQIVHLNHMQAYQLLLSKLTVAHYKINIVRLVAVKLLHS